MHDDQAELRKLWRKHWQAFYRGASDPLPTELHALRYGAKTRAGTPCKHRELFNTSCTYINEARTAWLRQGKALQSPAGGGSKVKACPRIDQRGSRIFTQS